MSAVRDGYALVPGFLHFLEALRDVDVYAGVPAGPEGGENFETKVLARVTFDKDFGLAK